VKDLLVENPSEGDDTVSGALSVDLTLPAFANIENIKLLGSANLFGKGTDLANSITGNLGANLLDGRGGNDTIDGDSGNDTIIGGLGNDSMFGGFGNDTFYVDSASDKVAETTEKFTDNAGIDTVISDVDFVLDKQLENLTLVEGKVGKIGTGNDSANLIIGNSNDNLLTGLVGTDTLTGNAGKDTMDGGTGFDILTGGDGDDLYIVDSTLDKVVESSKLGGDDRVESSDTYILSANVEDLTLTGTKSVNGTGNAEDNLIIGNSGNNILDGLVGADTMRGGDGDDTYTLDNVNDLVDEAGKTGSDTLRTALFGIDLQEDVAFHVEWLEFENVTLLGTGKFNAGGDAGNNRLIGNSNANNLVGRDGNDTLDGGLGADTMIGGKGDDTYFIDNAKDVIDETDGDGIDTVSSTASYILAAGFENITLVGKANINATGSDDKNVIIGNIGANIIDGKGGADTMTGDKGNDTYIVDGLGDVVIEDEAASGGIDSVRSDVSFTLSKGVENLTLVAGKALATDGIGNASNNVITGNENDNLLVGNEANDVLIGGVGNDTLNGGSGIDNMIGGLGADVYFVDSKSDKVGGEGADAKDVRDLVQSTVTWTLGANFEDLTLLEPPTPDTPTPDAFGNGLANHIIGNSRSNFINGMAGADTMEGGKGDDTYRIESTLDVIVENAGEGTDLVQSSVSIQNLWLNVDNVTLFGSGNLIVNCNDIANHVQGSAGANKIDGRGGDDTLYGFAGNDTLTGGTGNDVFQRLNPSDGVDRITDFEKGTTGNPTDKIDVSNVLVGFEEGENIADFIRLVGDGKGNTLVQLDANGAAGGHAYSTVFVIEGQVFTDVTTMADNFILEKST
jgi:Ca2+-binding RTX toxin-like protein